MKKLGLVGWRGMVGSVLMQRMVEERDFDYVEPVYFSTSSVGEKGPTFGGKEGGVLHDAKSIETLKQMDIIITCQGGDYTKEIFPKLRASGWNGHWIDAASSLRMEKDAVIVLDPVNLNVIKDSLSQGGKNWFAHAYGAGWFVPEQSRRVDFGDDLSGGFGSWRAEHARADFPDGRLAPSSQGRSGRSGFSHSGY